MMTKTFQPNPAANGSDKIQQLEEKLRQKVEEVKILMLSNKMLRKELAELTGKADQENVENKR